MPRKPIDFQPVLYTPGAAAGQPVTPTNGTDFKLKQLRELLECDLIEVVYLYGSDEIFLVDEMGSFPADRTRNAAAEAVWYQHVPAAKGHPIYGRVIHCHTDQFR